MNPLDLFAGVAATAGVFVVPGDGIMVGGRVTISRAATAASVATAACFATATGVATTAGVNVTTTAGVANTDNIATIAGIATAAVDTMLNLSTTRFIQVPGDGKTKLPEYTSVVNIAHECFNERLPTFKTFKRVVSSNQPRQVEIPPTASTLVKQFGPYL